METGYLAFIVFLATACQTIVNIVKAKLPVGERAAWLWPLAALGVGIGLSFAFQVSIVRAVPILAEYSQDVAWPVERILAGVLIGGGASFIYDVIDR